MDLLQIITGLLCVGAIIYLIYQIKELYHAFKNTDNFKDFLENKDYDKEKLLAEIKSLKEENKNLKAELMAYQLKLAHEKGYI